MEYTWKPSDTVGEDGEVIAKTELTGTVLIDLPKYAQRLKYLKETKIKIDDSGAVVSTGDGDQLDLIIKAVEIAEKHIKTVDLKTKSGKEIKTLDDMQYSSECQVALQEIGFTVINGPK